MKFDRGTLTVGRDLFSRNFGQGNGNEWDEFYPFPQIEGQRERGGTSTTQPEASYPAGQVSGRGEAITVAMVRPHLELK